MKLKNSHQTWCDSLVTKEVLSAGYWGEIRKIQDGGLFTRVFIQLLIEHRYFSFFAH